MSRENRRDRFRTGSPFEQDPDTRTAGSEDAEYEIDADAEDGEPLREQAVTERAPEAPAEKDLLRAERDRLYEAWLRATADLDNYKKRVERDRHEFRAVALEGILRQLLPVLDNFERALELEPDGLPKSFHDGVRLIQKQLRDVLFKQGLEIMETTGETFDPHLHEAVETEVRTDVPAHSILAEVMKGYKLGKRVLRPAMVRVSVRPEESRSDLAGDGGEPFGDEPSR